MTRQAADLLVEALRLSEGDRGELIAGLLESLDSEADADTDAAWGEEIRHRIEEIETGQVQSVPWPEARRQILDDADDAGRA
jgi:putative addiction module component (TIGR02574 family)